MFHKLLVGKGAAVVIAVFAIGGSAVVVEASASGSADPNAWVQSFRDRLDAVAGQHQQGDVRDDHAATGPRTNHKDHEATGARTKHDDRDKNENRDKDKKDDRSDDAVKPAPKQAEVDEDRDDESEAKDEDKAEHQDKGKEHGKHKDAGKDKSSGKEHEKD
jgi:hypothetical protein